MDVELLNDIVAKTNSLGIANKIKHKYPDMYSELMIIKSTKNCKTFSEAIYLTIHNLDSIPVCPELADNCAHKLKFKGLELGYSEYCSKCIKKSDEYKNKIKKTNLERYGVDNPMKLHRIVEKGKDTCLKKYGTRNIHQLESVKRAKRKTLEENYGSLGFANPIINDKKIQTNISRYGVEWGLQHDDVKQKSVQTCLDKYGVANCMQTDEMKQKFSDLIITDEYIQYVKDLIVTRGFILKSEYINSHSPVIVTCEKCGTDISLLWNSFQQGCGICPNCYPYKSGRSKAEMDISNFVKSLGIDVINNDTTIIAPKELDIVIPSKKIAIEYCGLWCHSSGGNVPIIKDKTYHMNKLDACTAAGYRLITIFEDEWILHRDVVESKLKYILGAHDDMLKIRASKCELVCVPYRDKHEFLNKYHLQNDMVSSINIGLKYNSELVAVMTFGDKGRGIFNLERYCCKPNTIIYGGSSRLLKSFKKRPWTTIFTFADRRWSVGDVYDKIGFTLMHTTSLNYWYWGKGIKGRKHRSNFSKHKLTKSKYYKDHLTEFQIMSLENAAWIYDCGNYKYILKR